MPDLQDTMGGSAPSGPGAAPGSGLVETFRAQVDELAATARQETARLASDARRQVRDVVRRRQVSLAERLGGVAAALRDAGRRLDQEVADGLGDVVGRAAQRVERASGYVRRSEPRDMARDVEDFARRRPAAFLGGSFVAGLLLARFLKSSGGRAEWEPGSGGRLRDGAPAAGLPGELPGRP